MNRLDLHGLGHELTVDVPHYAAKAGQRIKWSLSMTPVRELLNVPIQVREDVELTENDIDSRGYGVVVETGRCLDATLGQVIQGMLWELSFHGGPSEQTTEFRAELMESKAEVDAGTAETFSCEDLFESMDRPGMLVMFQSIGDVPAIDVCRAMREIPDAQNAAEALKAKFGGEVHVREKFQDRTGREFRKTFRAAGR